MELEFQLPVTSCVTLSTLFFFSSFFVCKIGIIELRRVVVRIQLIYVYYLKQALTYNKPV